MRAVQSVPFASRPSRSMSRTAALRRRTQSPAPVRVRAVEPARSIPIRTFAEFETSTLSKLRIVLQPMLGPREGLDVTEALTRAVATELWKLHGGNDVMNWLEAERLLGEVLRSSERRP